jgi:hypothetical protein
MGKSEQRVDVIAAEKTGHDRHLRLAVRDVVIDTGPLAQGSLATEGAPGQHRIRRTCPATWRLPETDHRRPGRRQSGGATAVLAAGEGPFPGGNGPSIDGPEGVVQSASSPQKCGLPRPPPDRYGHCVSAGQRPRTAFGGHRVRPAA